MIPFQVHGLPVHPLAVHATVVLVPLAALLAVLFVVRRTRSWAALPMALVSVAALLSVFVSRATGFNFKAHFVALAGGAKAWDSSALGKAVHTHQNRANVLFYEMIVFAVLAVAVYLVWRGGDRFSGVVEVVACTLLVAGVLVLSLQIYLVGESGAKAVWNPDGTVSYSSGGELRLPWSPTGDSRLDSSLRNDSTRSGSTAP